MNFKTPDRNLDAQMLIFAIIFMSLMVLSSCQAGLTARRQDIQLHVGTIGVVPKFIDKAPAQRMLEDTQGPIVIEIQNQGASDVQGGVWALAADTGVFEFTGDAQGSFSVEGRSKTNPFAGKTLIETKLRSLELDPQRQTHDGTVTATICYPYETKAGINVCIDTDPLNIAQRKKVCQSSAVSGGGGQGGPVSVTRIEPNMVPDGDYVVPQFTIQIANSASGLVLDPRKVSLACESFGSSPDLFNVVDVSARLTDTPLDCTGRVTLEDGKATVDCVATQGFPRALGAYLAPLTISLKYGYTQSISTQVRVERRPDMRTSR